MYYADVTFGQQQYFIACTDKGLCYLDTQAPTQSADTLYDANRLAPYIQALACYFNEGKAIHVPLDYQGTTFQKSVWQALQTIAYGDTVSYQDIAQKIGRPTAIRAVANAIGKNPILIAIPCHRVIGKNGQLTGFRAGLALKQALLTHESRKKV